MISVELVECLAEDRMVVNAARVLEKKWIKYSRLNMADVNLIKMMMKERHGTPFEHNYFQFRVSIPIFAQRDWFKHRIGSSFNEISTRWMDMGSQPVYAPDYLREQTKGTKRHEYSFQPWSRTWISEAWNARRLRRAQEKALKKYGRLVKSGVAMEQAMAVLPMGLYTTFIWSCNARSLMHFLSLRSDEHARLELQVAAKHIERAFQARMPVTWAAWDEHGRVAP